MEIKELREKTKNELNLALSKAREELAKLGIDLARKKLKNTSSLRKKGREIARILTVIKEKEILKNAA